MAKRIGILGSGMVGRTLGKGFLNSGYDVMIGTRDINKLDDWKKTGDNALVGSFEKAAKFGEVIVLATKWTGAENAVKLAGKENFAILILLAKQFRNGCIMLRWLRRLIL